MFCLIRQKNARFTDRRRSSLPPVGSLGSQHCCSFLSRWESQASRHYLLKSPCPVWMFTRHIFPRTNNFLTKWLGSFVCTHVLSVFVLWTKSKYICKKCICVRKRKWMVTGRGFGGEAQVICDSVWDVWEFSAAGAVALVQIREWHASSYFSSVHYTLYSTLTLFSPSTHDDLFCLREQCSECLFSGKDWWIVEKLLKNV